MALFRRRRVARARPADTPAAPPDADARRATRAHLTEFVRTRVGVEAYLEPATRFQQTTVLLVATTGEWTRRRVPDERAARELAQELAIPVYDVQLTGYPQRVRDWNTRQRARARGR